MKTTFFTSPSKGTGLRGIELDRCYTGGFDEEGRRHGFGVYKFPNHMTYEGHYVAGLKQGAGKLTFPDGGWYEGEFQNNEIHGRGVRKFSGGNTYTGDFEMGEMYGQGIMKFSSGDCYEGSFVRNVMEGHGTMRFQNGNVYKGQFRANKINGQGTMKYKSGDEYAGSWRDGKRCGTGNCNYHDGNCYQGDWDADVPHGEGRLDVLLGNLRYDGAFAYGKPTQVPVKMNVTYPNNVQQAPPAPKKSGKPTQGAAMEGPVMPVTLGVPLSFPITLSTQFERPLREEELLRPVTPPTKGSSASKHAATYAMPLGPVISEPPTEGFAWQTAEMESQRVVFLTLHPGPPSPLPSGTLIGLSIVNVVIKATGETRLRVLFLPAHLDAPLPMSRTEDGEAINGLETKLEHGQAVIEDLIIGTPDAMPSTPTTSSHPAEKSAASATVPPVFDGLATASGTGCLVVSSWAIKPGFMRVQLAELKQEKGKK